MTARVYEIVVKRFNDIEERKYYRFRGGPWYGGIATGDAVGCNLRCRFCWAWKIRDNPAKSGRFYTPSPAPLYFSSFLFLYSSDKSNSVIIRLE